MKPPYDLFISYKSEDANLVRGVTECLISHGLKAWFAEYAIRLPEYRQDRQEHGLDFPIIQAKIDEAIDRSRFFLAFTNRKWAASTFCQKESDRILKLVGYDTLRIAQICIRHDPGDKPLCVWGRSLVIDYPSSRPQDSRNPARVAKMIEFINSLPWFDHLVKVTPTEIEDRTVRLRFGMQLGLGPFVTEDPRRTFGEAAEHPGEHYRFEGRIGEYDADLVVAINPYYSTLDNFQDLDRSYSNNHKVYESYTGVAEKWLGHSGMEERGAHLVFREKRRQFALTSTVHHSSGRTVWERRYALLLGNDADVTGELALVFNTILPANDDASWQAFCKMAPVFDSIVYSIPAYIPQDSLFAPENLQVLLAKLGLSIVSGCLCASTHSASLLAVLPTRESVAIVQAFSALVFGGVLTDFLLALRKRSKSRRLVSVASMSVQPSVIPSVIFPTISPGCWRMLYHVWNMTFASLRLFARAFLLGLARGWLVIIPLALFAIPLALFAILGPITSALYWFLLGAGIFWLGSKHLEREETCTGRKHGSGPASASDST